MDITLSYQVNRPPVPSVITHVSTTYKAITCQYFFRLKKFLGFFLIFFPGSSIRLSQLRPPVTPGRVSIPSGTQGCFYILQFIRRPYQVVQGTVDLSDGKGRYHQPG